MRYFCRKLETLARRVVQFYTQTLGFSISNTIFFVKNIESEKNGSFYEQKTECLGLKKTELNNPPLARGCLVRGLGFTQQRAFL